MGWATGCEIAEDIWESVKVFISENRYKEASKVIYEIFDNMDADDWSSYNFEGSLFRTYAELNEPELLEDLDE